MRKASVHPSSELNDPTVRELVHSQANREMSKIRRLLQFQVSGMVKVKINGSYSWLRAESRDRMGSRVVKGYNNRSVKIYRLLVFLSELARSRLKPLYEIMTYPARMKGAEQIGLPGDLSGAEVLHILTRQEEFARAIIMIQYLTVEIAIWSKGFDKIWCLLVARVIRKVELVNHEPEIC
jgi:hypothetical protein